MFQLIEEIIGLCILVCLLIMDAVVAVITFIYDCLEWVVNFVLFMFVFCACVVADTYDLVVAKIYSGRNSSYNATRKDDSDAIRSEASQRRRKSEYR